jgi:hypothetical protein
LQVEEGLPVATTVEELGAPPPLVIEAEGPGAPPPSTTAAAVEEGQATVETTAPQVVSEAPAGAGSGGTDVVMVPLDEDSAPPLPAGGRDVVMSTASEASPAVGALEPSSTEGGMTVEEVMELVTRLYVDFPSIGVVDLEAPELPSNDREMLEVATERMFAEPSILETIASVRLTLHQYESPGGSAPPAASEAAEAILVLPAAGTKSAAVVPVPPPMGEG